MVRSLRGATHASPGAAKSVRFDPSTPDRDSEQPSSMRKLRSCWSSFLASVVPTAHASSRHHYYRSRRGGGAAGRLLLSQHAGAAGSGRPHTLYLAPSTSSTPPTAVTTSTMENRGGTLRKMAASFESIGSCSLDVDITASESSGLLESRGGCGASLSQRTLHSLDSQRLVAHSTEELSTTSSSRQYVKRAAKLFDSADISNSDDSVFTPPRARPSYVSLSCSVSGYTRATNYSSSRLRDPSPCARQTGGGSPSPLLLARTSPAHRSTGRLINPGPPPPTMNGHHADTVDCASVKLNGQSSSSVGNMMHFSKQTYISHMGPSSMYNESSSWHSSQVKQPEGGMSNGAAANTSKSFIQQRVERLYGRGALAQGFFRNTKVSTTTNGTSGSHTISQEHTNGEHHSESANSNFPELPVLRLLRPEFREQLSIGQPSLHPWWKQRQSPPRACNGTSPTTSPREHIIPVTIESDCNANQKASGCAKEVPQKVVATEKVDEPGGDLASSVVSVCDVAIQAQEIPCDLQPAAPEVVPAVPVASSSKPESDGNAKDGHYFLQLLNKETQRLLAMAAETEVELEAKPDLPEEVSGKLRAAIGQARLLVRQKLQQFEGLCHRNLTQSGEEQFPTTCDDLAGFWDMVQLQVAHVDSLFQELKEMKERGWQEVSPRLEVKNGKPKGRRSTTSTSGTPKNTPKLSEKAQEAARLRDEQRKKMMEERRKTAKLQKKAEEGSVEIFAPDANS
ncbi:hypothetical protein B566_EDAN008084 [Ephemera danica]|nr:hypothetical protein B566_EDAN008084 [Ephemera danica]